MGWVKSIVKCIIPCALLRLNRRWKLSRLRKANQAKPIKEVFTSIYEQHQWGGTGDEYCSGSGSSELHASRYAAVLQKTKKYRYVLVTEHYPTPSVKSRPNLDKPHGPDTRIYDNSAVYLDQPPFNVPPESITLVSEVDAQTYLVHKGERLRTFLIENEPND